ncbi:MBL fold metallo-hydrolase [Saccharopolyspora oryzae]|uniref:MBL fold metallo-hydrolase n=1 Tax=Saccharopolyspora oryzae TaxID=2997343 RepID=UPI0038CD9AFB
MPSTPLRQTDPANRNSEKALVTEGQCIKVGPEADPAVVGLLGCGVMAGFGAVFDATHTAQPIVDAVAVAVVCTHGHNDHITVSPELGDAFDAPVLLHPGKRRSTADNACALPCSPVHCRWDTHHCPHETRTSRSRPCPSVRARSTRR